MDVRLKRACEPAAKADGCRVLVDRLWPRGVSKDTAQIDWWARDLAPSTELRKWFGHDDERWSEFQRRYRAELKDSPQREVLQELRERAAKGRLTLVFGARNEAHNNAVVLKALLE
ncbi:MAG TPA: DUF488 family protein [Rhodanobacteraceae bacterium]|nr:DUF488 family protein [Rhodanobacteraceae bacterium]